MSYKAPFELENPEDLDTVLESFKGFHRVRLSSSQSYLSQALHKSPVSLISKDLSWPNSIMKTSFLSLVHPNNLCSILDRIRDSDISSNYLWLTSNVYQQDQRIWVCWYIEVVPRTVSINTKPTVVWVINRYNICTSIALKCLKYWRSSALIGYAGNCCFGRQNTTGNSGCIEWA